MNRSTCAIALSIVMAVIVAPNANGQSVASEASLQSAQATAGSVKLLNARRTVGDTMIVEFEDTTLTFDGIQTGTWTFGPRASARRSPKQVGREIAQTIWRGVPRDSGIRTIVINVHSAKKADDAANIRLFYRTDELSLR